VVVWFASSLGRQSPVYLASIRRATASIGAPMRPVLAMVQPSPVRMSVACSVPTGAPRMKIVNVVVPDSGAAGCACAAHGTASIHASATARIEWLEGMPQHSTAYQAARQRAGIIDRSDRGRIVVSGADRASYLQGLLTNDVVALTAGSGCYAVYLTAQGRMIADMWVYETGALMLVTVNGDVK